MIEYAQFTLLHVLGNEQENNCSHTKTITKTVLSNTLGWQRVTWVVVAVDDDHVLELKQDTEYGHGTDKGMH